MTFLNISKHNLAKDILVNPHSNKYKYKKVIINKIILSNNPINNNSKMMDNLNYK